LKLNHIEEFINSENEVRAYGFNILDDEALEKIQNQKNKIFKKFGDKEYNSEMSSQMVSERENFQSSSGGLPHGKKGDESGKKMEHSNPVYQVFTSFEYQMRFNNQNADDEINTKLLLLLPMIPGRAFQDVKLNHLRLYN
jgi:hypothetical protein